MWIVIALVAQAILIVRRGDRVCAALDDPR
jgi:hypothetical protein